MAVFRCPNCNGWIKLPNVYQYEHNTKIECFKCSTEIYITGNKRKKLSLTKSSEVFDKTPKTNPKNPNSIVNRIIALGKHFVRFLAKIFGLYAGELLENLKNIENGVNEFKDIMSYNDYFTGYDLESWHEKYSEYHQYLDT